MTDTAETADLVVAGADLVATVDDERREIAGRLGGVPRRVRGRGRRPAGRPSRRRPTATLRADGCLVTPGLVNTHHHIYQNLTRAYRPATGGILFDWLTTLYPRWALLDEEAAYLSAWVGPGRAGAGRLHHVDRPPLRPPGGRRRPAGAEIAAARELGVRFHPTRGSMSLSQKDGGLPPDSVVQDDDTILADVREAVARHHDPAPGRHGPGGAGAVLAVLGDARPDAAHRRAGRAARRPPAHPPRRGPRRGHLLPGDLRLPAHRALRGRAAGAPTGRGWPTASTRTTTRSPASAAGAPAWPTAPAPT